MTEMNRREALKAGAAGMALVASPFAIAHGSAIQELDADDAVFGAECPRHFVSIPPKKV